MIVLSILLVIKTLIFLSLTNAVHNQCLVFLTTVSLSLGIVVLLSLLNKKRRNIYLGIFYTFLSLIMFIDVIYYSYFNTLPSVELFEMVGMLGNVQNSVYSIISKRSLLFLIDLPFVYYYLYKFSNDFFENKDKLFAGGILLLVFVSTLFYGFSNSLFNSLRYQELYTYHTRDIIENIRGEEYNISTQPSIYSERDIEELKNRTKIINGPNTGIGNGKNLIVFQVEALQNFVINLHYNNQEITPNLNAFIEDSGSIYYDNYFQLIGRGNTSDAEFVTNNSLHPSMESPTYTQFQDNTFYGLPWILRDNGYSSWVFHGYEKTFWNRNKAYDNQGFQRYISQEDFNVGDVIELGITDGDFFDQSMDYLKELDSKDENPFYAFIITLSSHNPFTMPEKYKEIKLLEEHEDTILGDYLNSIHYVDKCIGEFMKNLKEEGLYDNTVFALYGDHFAIPNSSPDDVKLMGEFLGEKYNFDHIMNVPLIINVPNTNIGYTNHKVGSLIDFAPTILNILGYENQKGVFFGRDLENFDGYNNVKPQTIMRKGSFIDENVLFSMASTEIFESSYVEDRNTRERLDLSEYRPIYEDAIKDINLSNFILKNNLLKPLLEDGKAFSVLEIPPLSLHSNIVKLKENTILELDKVLLSQSDYISIDITLDNEENIVLNNKDKTSSEELSLWLEENEDAVLLLRTKIEDNEFYNKLKYAIKESTSDHIIEIHNFDEFYFVQAYGFQNIILNNTNLNYTEEELVDFLNAHNLYGIIVNKEDLTGSLKKVLNKHNTVIYEEKANFLQVIR